MKLTDKEKFNIRVDENGYTILTLKSQDELQEAIQKADTESESITDRSSADKDVGDVELTDEKDRED